MAQAIEYSASPTGAL